MAFTGGREGLELCLLSDRDFFWRRGGDGVFCLKRGRWAFVGILAFLRAGDFVRRRRAAAEWGPRSCRAMSLI